MNAGRACVDRAVNHEGFGLRQNRIERPGSCPGQRPGNPAAGAHPSRTGEDILNLIRDLSSSLKMTVVMVTHERALAERFAQRLIFLGDGKLLHEEVPA